jgi:choline dehydrogenase-like flavoprotein
VKYDVIVIGTGAGGGTLVNLLARQGKRVLVLERGGWVKREPQNMDPREVFQLGRYVSPDTWTDGVTGKPFRPGAHYNVGGATKFYGAALFRLRPGDFGPVRHVDGISPAWPIRYGDLEPFYTQAEQMYQVHGSHGEDPGEGYWTDDYPHPAVSHSPRIQRLSDDLAARGYRPFHAPAAVLLDERRPERSACMRCNFCDGHPCLVQGKADAEVIGIRPVMNLPNVELVTNCEVTHLFTNGSGQRVNRVSVLREGRREFYFGDIIVLAAGAVNTAKILLASGIANSSGQVGRNYMFHRSRAVMSIGAEPNDTVFQKTLAVHDFYWPNEELGTSWPLGGIQMVGKSSAAAMRGESPLAARAPGMTLEAMARHAVDWWLTTEDLPRPENRVTLDSRGQVTLTVRQTGKTEGDMLYRHLRRMVSRAGHGGFVSREMGLDAVAHQAGTARTGEDPSGSVVDADLRSHDLGNLYVCDASVFPSVGAVNPALTVMALACRLGAHLS